jgi:aspartate racemase
MHKRIGLIGGTTPESTIDYYKYLTGKYAEKYGDLGFPEIIIFSVSFQNLVDWANSDRWDLVEEKLTEAALTLEKAGAGLVCLTANTLHKFYHQLKARLQVPMISIIDTLIEELRHDGKTRVALLGTRPTMEEDFYKEALKKAGIETIIPNEKDREFIHRTIYEELSRGVVKPESKTGYAGIAESLKEAGAQGIIQGCTEIPMILTGKDTSLPLYNTLELHAERILETAVEKE